MRIFGKKEEGESFGKGFVPVDRVKELMSQGLSDKEIIEQLKEEGFSYSEIERAMIEALKTSKEVKPIPVSFTSPPGQEPKPSGPAPEMPPLPSAESKPSAPPQPSEQPPEGVSMPAGEEQTYPPEFAIEEIVEGVVEEKWDKFNRRLDQIRSDQSTIREELNSLLTEIKSLRNQVTSKDEDISEKLEDLEKRLENVEAKAGGLERVFRQFFPKIFEKALSMRKMSTTEEEEEIGAA